jgi:hypothetical protein
MFALAAKTATMRTNRAWSWGVRRIFVRFVLGVVVSIATLLLVAASPSTAAAADCQFVLGFKLIRDQIPDRVGDCLENERFNVANGNAEQRTTAHHGQGGLLVWRKSDNWTAFTDGHWTWFNGPRGIQRRLNTERFEWEMDPVTTASATCSSNPGSVIKSRDVDIVRYQLAPSPSRPETAQLDVTIRNNCDQTRLIQFAARVEVDGSRSPIAVGQNFFPGGQSFGPGEERRFLYGWCQEDGSCPRIEPSAQLVFRWNWRAPDSDALHCLDIGASRCLPTDPWLRSTVVELATLPEGAALLKRGADFGVTVRRGDLRAEALGSYSTRSKAIVLSRELDSVTEFERATVLAHELQHAVDHAANRLGSTPENCFQAEVRAFTKQAEIWQSLWRGVLPRALNRLQAELNRITTFVRSDPEALKDIVQRAYHSACGQLQG